ncbi:S-locus glycoprotein [Trema orientale]|uniref:non-specific serine/threonine protein kinase n=1 Tax=Trema orientale TaxID=63057 RepID=A0A2P5EMF7_TREOI|nr:S-locus glycoprotein [Trema orientale]
MPYGTTGQHADQSTGLDALVPLTKMCHNLVEAAVLRFKLLTTVLLVCKGTIEAFSQIADPSAGKIRVEYTRSAIAAYTVTDTISPKQSLNDNETLVSANEIFELGFFSPSNSKNRYLGIWYKQAPNRVVWVANRDNPITDSYGVLTISNIGELVILNQTGGAVWSSNISSMPKNSFLQLLNSGNLVLRDNASTSYVWQSFDYPSDTLLPGMKLSWNIESGQERYITSWKAPDDPSIGNCTHKIDKKELPQLVLLMGMAKKLRTGVWDGVQFSGSPLSYQVLKPLIEFDGHEWSYRFERNSNEFLGTVITVTQSASVQILILNYGSSEWTPLYSLPIGPCGSYGHCGANGICRISKNPMCECLEGFTPKSSEEWKALNWTSGCIRRFPLECHRGDWFTPLAAVKLPDLLEIWLNRSLTLEECKVECLRNCSCKAYSNSDVRNGGSGCVMWFRDLIDMTDFKQADSNLDIYIRQAATEPKAVNKSKMKKGKVTILVIAIIFGMSILILTFGCIIWKRETNKRERLESKKEDIDLPIFDFATIAAATNNFSNTSMLGEGGFGPVYKVETLLFWRNRKGIFSTGEEIAVKRLSKNSRQGIQEFKNEKFPADRPTMASVVFMLANDGAKLPWPKQPAFFIERSSLNVNSMSADEEQYTKNSMSITSFEGR